MKSKKVIKLKSNNFRGKIKTDCCCKIQQSSLTPLILLRLYCILHAVFNAWLHRTQVKIQM